MPRFGTFPHDLAGKEDRGSNWLDPDIEPDVAQALLSRGLSLTRTGPLVCTGLDTGLGALLKVDSDGTYRGAMAPWPGLNAPWRVCAVP